MHQPHAAGERPFVDFAGQTVAVIGASSGEIRRDQIFVALLGALNFTYSCATATQTTPDWVGSIIDALKFCGGVPRLMFRFAACPGRAARSLRARHQPPGRCVLRHYDVAILPARPPRQRGKPKFEIWVQMVERWILARLRNRRFCSLRVLNAAIAKLLTDLNTRAFKKQPGCSASAFAALDRPALRPLPATRMPNAYFKRARVNRRAPVPIQDLVLDSPTFNGPHHILRSRCRGLGYTAGHVRARVNPSKTELSKLHDNAIISASIEPRRVDGGRASLARAAFFHFPYGNVTKQAETTMKKVIFSFALGMAALAAGAQTWPDKTVTLVVPFPPGGSTDQVARSVAPILGSKLNQSFIIDNRAGATGTIGAAFVKRAAPDGATFLVTSLGPLVIVPHLLKGMQYDPIKDFDPITVAVASPNVLVVPANSPHKSVADIIAHEKAHPGKMTFASSGNGSSDHLTAELFWQQSGTSGVHVPYKGGGPAQTDLMGGQVDASFQNINTVLQFIKGGRMRALAITSAKRSPLLPDVPTLAEAGVKGVEVTSWQAVVAPKGLPQAIRDKANAAFVEAMNDPKVKEQFTSVGFEIVANTPAQFAAFQQAEYTRWKKVIETGKITID